MISRFWCFKMLNLCYQMSHISIYFLPQNNVKCTNYKIGLIETYFKILIFIIKHLFNCKLASYLKSLFVCLNHIQHIPCSAHAGYIGTYRRLLTGRNVLLLRQITRDLLHALSHRHDNTLHGFGELVVSTG